MLTVHFLNKQFNMLCRGTGSDDEGVQVHLIEVIIIKMLI